MNERFEKLVAEAFFDETADASDTKIYKLNDAQMQKFAELIVRECNYLIQQQVSLKYKDGWEQSGISDDWAGGHYAASILSRTVIKKHFGVAE